MTWIRFLDIALIPSIIGKDKPSWKTSLPTALMLWTYCVGYAGNHLWLALSAGIFSASAWTILFFQVIRRRKANLL